VKSSARLLAVLLLVGGTACGKKGPPLPPLVRVPTPPGNFSVQRRGSAVTIDFVVPGGNTDGSTPGDVSRVDVFALTSPGSVTPDQIVRQGTRIGRVLVNPPPDPDAPEGQPAPPSAPAPPGGVDQAAVAHVEETFTPEAGADPADLRTYVAVGFNKHGRPGRFSTLAAIPITPPPEAPGQPDVSWDETSITITWPAVESTNPDVPLGYHVYVPGDLPTRLTDHPLVESTFVDKRIEWGAERCYVVRSVETLEQLTLESDASPSTCVTLTDTFAPMAPQGLTVVASEAAINLIWNPNTEKDLAGYVLWRAMPADGTLTPITPEPVKESTFRDTVPAGSHVAYAVQAVDQAGNVSPISDRVEETAR
jgi:predicted small lipoprotein YifL